MLLKTSKLLEHSYLEQLADKTPLVESHRFLQLTIKGRNLTLVLTTAIFQSVVKIEDVVDGDTDITFGVDVIKFFRALKSFSSEINLTISGNTLNIKDDSLSIKLPIVNKDFLAPLHNHKKGEERLFYGTLNNNWYKLNNFVSSETGTFSGIFLKVGEGDILETFATDRMNVFWIKNKSSASLKVSDTSHSILPKEVAVAISKIPTLDTIPILISRETDGQAISFLWGEHLDVDGNGATGSISSRVIYGSLPDTNRILNQPFTHQGIVNGSELLNVLRLYTDIVDIKRITFTIKDGSNLTINEPTFKKLLHYGDNTDTSEVTFSTNISAILKIISALNTSLPIVIKVSSDTNFIEISTEDETAICSKIRGF